MGTTTLAERLTRQLTPIAELMSDIITSAYEQCADTKVRETWPGMTRAAHRARICGIVVWVHVADGLVAAAENDRLPDGFAVLTSDKQHNAGRYLLRFPGGVLTIRRTPHDDEKAEGQFMQETFTEMLEQLDQAAVPERDDASRVWIRLAPGGATMFVAEDRHGHQVKIPLADLLHHAAPPVTPSPGTPPVPTGVRSRLVSAQDSDAR